MSITLFNAIENKLAIAANLTTTENGAITLKSTGSNLVDFFSRAGAMRNESTRLLSLFSKALTEDSLIAILILFYLRDVRGGQGERSTFILLLHHLAVNHSHLAKKVLSLVPFYGRWDDLIKSCLNTRLGEDVADIIKEQLYADVHNLMLNPSEVSLCAKWLPSENSGKKAKKYFNTLIKYFSNSLTRKDYRVLVSGLRKHLNIVERQLCSNKWKEVDYSTLPSKAAFMYRKAFAKHDTTRYQKYLESLQKGEKGVKINAATLYPYEIVHSMLENRTYTGITRDITLEEQWKALPDFIGGSSNSIAVVDTSSSMYRGSLGNVNPIDISVSLGLYLAERNTSPIWKNKFISFDTTPKLISIKGNNLTEIVYNLYKAPWGGSTNLQAVFDLILSSANSSNLTQPDLPDVIYIISDMEFNHIQGYASKTNYEVIDRKFTAAGYTRPRLVFWNVSSKNNQSPVKYDENGTALYSGFSPTVFKSVTSLTNFTPIDAMMGTLVSERYMPLIEALVN